MATITPEQELSQIQTQNFAGGTYYGRTPNGIVDLRTGSMVPGSAASGGNSNNAGANGALDPVIAGSGVRRYTGTGTPGADPAAAAFAAGGALDTAGPDEAKIRADAQAAVQAQIDAIKNTYTGILAQADITGQNNLGRTRATAARGGTLGSDFGNADLANTAQLNDQQKQTILAERDSKISAIMTGATTRADTLIENAKNRASTNTAAYLDHLKSVADATKADIVNLAKSGASINDLTDQEYNTLLDQSGMTPEQFHASFILNKPQPTVLTTVTQGSKYIVVSKDPITGKTSTDTIDLGFTVPPEYNSQKLDDGTVIFTPKTWDPKKPLKDQILTYGSPSADYTLGVQNKQLQNQKLGLEIDQLNTDNGTKQDLKDAAAAISAGADPDKVRQRFLDDHPKAGDLYLKYTKQAY